jgi:hypothetical protein
MFSVFDEFWHLGDKRKANVCARDTKACLFVKEIAQSHHIMRLFF